ncbi:hypothetical protein [uncultured Serratia sp.]|uniref:hypothetical protein n=1 Tax=uncultured Serratia sp. TaxID=239175 RepID=UPI0025867F52|nr:hypothetical protein [uncultured Serratia sp.]
MILIISARAVSGAWDKGDMRKSDGGRKKAPAKMRGKTHNNTREIGNTHFADTIRILWVNFTKILCSECDKNAVVHK